MPPHVLFLARPTKKNDDTQKGPRMDAWMDNYLLIIKTKNNPPTTQFKSVKCNQTKANHTTFSTLRKSVWNFCSSTACWVDLKRRWSDEQETPVPSLKTSLVFSRRRTTESFQMHRRCWAEPLTGRSRSLFSKYLSLISYFRTAEALKDNLMQTQAFGCGSSVEKNNNVYFSQSWNHPQIINNIQVLCYLKAALVYFSALQRLIV